VSPSSSLVKTGDSGSQLSDLDKRIAAAHPGTVIHLSSGDYHAIDDFTARQSWVTVSGAGDASAPTIAGADLWGAERVRFVYVKFSNTVNINHSPTAQYGQRSKDIEILNSTIDCGSASTNATQQTYGVGVRGGSENITLSGDYVHDCTYGFSSAVQDLRSSGLVITHSTFSHFSADAMFLGGLSRVNIDDDVISDIDDPAGVVHNDGLLIVGNDLDIKITNDVLKNSRSQLILMQPSPIMTATGVTNNYDIVVAHCLLYGASAVAVQDHGAVDAVFVGNSIWDNYYGSLWVTGAPNSPATGTVIVDNIIQGYETYDSTPAVENHNLLYDVLPKGSYGKDDLVNVSPDFGDSAAGDFRLRSRSPAINAGVAYPRVVRQDIGHTDLFGLQDPSKLSIGAFQLHDPVVRYGPTLYLGPGGLPACVPTATHLCA
jgi:hypothetical protein